MNVFLKPIKTHTDFLSLQLYYLIITATRRKLKCIRPKLNTCLPRLGTWDILRWELGDPIRWVLPFSRGLYFGLCRSQRSRASQASFLMPVLVRLTARAMRAGRLFGWSSKHLDGETEPGGRGDGVSWAHQREIRLWQALIGTGRSQGTSGGG